jgi:CheY-like chemotaxis protein
MAKILLADDSVDVASMLCEMLMREGHHVDVVHNGRKLVEHVENSGSYDVIFTDLLMPELDGFGALYLLRSKGVKTPIFVMSGGGVTLNSDDALRAVEALDTGVMKKPVKCADLIERIQSVS